MKKKILLISILSFITLLVIQVLFSLIFYYFFPDKKNAELLVQVSIDFSFIITIIGLKYFWSIELFKKISLPTQKNLILILILAFLTALILPSLDYNFIIELIKNRELKVLNLNLEHFSFNSPQKIYSYLRLIIIMPILEEVLFRKILLVKLIERYSYITSILITSLLFSLGHLSLGQLLPTFLSGLILGTLYLKTKNISSAILLHSIINIFILIFDFKVISINGLNSLFILIYPVSIFVIVFILSKKKR